MRVLITGATGFVGRWLEPEFERAGHAVVGLPEPEILDIADRPGVRAAVLAAEPDAIVHLAAMAYGPDAEADAAEAIRVNVGGTLAVLEAARIEAPGAAVLVIGSSEVYEPPTSGSPISEAGPLGPRGVYGLTKLAAEALALGHPGVGPVAVARSFNHTGPGQRPVFAVPAFAQRIIEAKRAGVHRIHAGNLDVARDVGDVRDVVVAYRLLVEALVAGRVPHHRRVYNVATGRAVPIRFIVERLAALADWPVAPERDPDLVRPDDPTLVRGDASALRELTGWAPSVPLEQTLADVLASLT